VGVHGNLHGGGDAGAGAGGVGLGWWDLCDGVSESVGHGGVGACGCWCRPALYNRALLWGVGTYAVRWRGAKC
jgi:hypothetical protein